MRTAILVSSRVMLMVATMGAEGEARGGQGWLGGVSEYRVYDPWKRLLGGCCGLQHFLAKLLLLPQGLFPQKVCWVVRTHFAPDWVRIVPGKSALQPMLYLPSAARRWAMLRFHSRPLSQSYLAGFRQGFEWNAYRFSALRLVAMMC
ncbi:hypothetical protein HRR83_003454 [Exophiala dermatitidis]|uniref:Uncharacterized protein n=2 Tax=Exophiala dermatitidis TaxID=5970 RepID=H6BM47_EXODN|nr:uncharacterized protein HMPREF1120_00206 [Exophiala dermatitidis NIH/UT8656]KAJ4518089.1 hypothetical protein HRR74_004384 [Exophiala dermatitidis]EHY51983.1 hypothetical protein HMPREF1120_00206 [Exophiala dermatitidis NIH/UT8656]KAJ4520988.1 hypothetical protein HRR73_003329 [Exophiala dermatitidis]KAJ4547568.1 hypothetical protein HRR76_000202 [Exophiala dermatitidis]KAJ4553508.1 hypothetical protein HRR77_001894 [Exophiala dermatitidis]